MPDVPPIPATLTHRPTIGGLVIPWVNVRLADGGVDFRAQHTTKAIEAWRRGLCQVCGRGLTHPVVLFTGPDGLRRLLVDEPPLHAECAVYVSRACPMVAGRQTHYASGPSVSERHRGQRCYDPTCDCAGWVAGQHADRDGQPAHPWYALYVDGWALAVRPDGSLIGGLVRPDQVRAVRLVSEPGSCRCWRRVPLDEALAGYEPPARYPMREADYQHRNREPGDPVITTVTADGAGPE